MVFFYKAALLHFSRPGGLEAHPPREFAPGCEGYKKNGRLSGGLEVGRKLPAVVSRQ